MPARDSRHSQSVQLSTALHSRISASHWSVTRADLRALRLDVRAAVEAGEISPTDLDPFDPADFSYGPNIYTVNEQFIKPVTAVAGKMSWALMRNPDGLKCDVFVTHAWQEGIYEFIDKVLYSWPTDARHAWCCMLANPQNLDISSMISSPSVSPFAVALQSATYMLVVPNRNRSVYTRLWCAYEAYLAREHNKIILVAALPVPGRILQAVAVSALGVGFGVVVAKLLLLSPLDCSRLAYATFVCFQLLAFCLLFLGGSRLRRLVNVSFAVICGIQVGFCVQGTIYTPMLGESVFPYEVRCLFWIIMGATGVVAEADRVRSGAYWEQSDLLRLGYTGSIMDASCAEMRDEVSIRAEIGDKVPDVEQAIQTLLQAGMSTESLRLAAEVGIGISDAGHVEVSVPIVMTCIDFLAIYCLFWLRVSGANMFVACLLIISKAVMLVLFFTAGFDGQVFQMRVASRTAVLHLAGMSTISVLVLLDQLSGGQAFVILNIGIATINVLNVTVIVGGLEGLLRFPYGGRFLAQLVLSRMQCRVLGKQRLAENEEETDSESDSTSSE